MSLDDQMNQNDGSMIDRIDNSLFNFNKKIAKKWQDKTGRDKKDLEKALYFGSSASFAGYFVQDPWKNLGIVSATIISGLCAHYESLRPKNKRHEEMGDEYVLGISRSNKYVRTCLYGIGAISFASGLGSIIAGISTGDAEYYKMGAECFSLSAGAISYTNAEYISSADVGRPPKKREKKPLKDRIKEKVESLIPQPAPKPAPAYVRGYSETKLPRQHELSEKE